MASSDYASQRLEQAVNKAADWSSSQIVTSRTPRAVTLTLKKIIDNEGARCNLDAGYLPDVIVYNRFYAENPDYVLLMANLYWRCFRQAAIWRVFCLLRFHGLVDLENLMLPIDIFAPTENTIIITRFLCCFSLIADDCNLTFSGKIPLAGYGMDCRYRLVCLPLCRLMATLF